MEPLDSLKADSIHRIRPENLLDGVDIASNFPNSTNFFNEREDIRSVIIAIDGPAGSGKSTTAREVARRTNSLYIDTGAMYRAVALFFLENGLQIETGDIGGILADVLVRLEASDKGVNVFLNGTNVNEKIRSSAVSELSSVVSRNSDVRNKMVSLQREMARKCVEGGGSVVMEGRDIGTVVFPDANFKFFLVADPKIRAQRRAAQLREKGVEANESELYQEIIDRDGRDESRALSPLKKAELAVEIDTSQLSFEEQVDNIIRVINGNG